MPQSLNFFQFMELFGLFLNLKALKKSLAGSFASCKVGLRLHMVAQTCNPSYLGGRDQKDCGLIPVWAKSPQDPI
jgi:hypothetical protein